jgi:hypothetical protein
MTTPPPVTFGDGQMPAPRGEVKSAASIRRRLLALGCTREQVARHLDRGRQPSDWCA